MNIPSHIKNIIFDFGGVILNLDEQKTFSELMRIMGCNKEELYTIMHTNNTFYKYECGLISSEEFVAHLQSLSFIPVKKEDVITAWNAMLLDFPEQHVRLLLNLKKTYRTFLLSNTNDLHEKAFIANMKAQGIQESIYDLFETVWYSHTLHLRKPNADIYEAVLKEANLNPHETLFLDDRQENLDGAKEVGISTMHITKDVTIMSLFSYITGLKH